MEQYPHYPILSLRFLPHIFVTPEFKKMKKNRKLLKKLLEFLKKYVHLALNSQKATAAAAATFKESTPGAMGMRTT